MAPYLVNERVIEQVVVIGLPDLIPNESEAKLFETSTVLRPNVFTIREDFVLLFCDLDANS